MKKIGLFILLQFIWICLLVGGLLMYHNFLGPEKAHPVRITIKSGNPEDNTLTLNPPADLELEVYKARKVTWNIDPSSNVDSFRIEKKDPSPAIFILGPPSSRTKSGWGTVFPIIIGDKVYSYNIFWKMKGDRADTPERRFDPKLAVKSRGFALFELLFYIVYAVLFFLSFRVFRTAKN